MIAEKQQCLEEYDLASDSRYKPYVANIIEYDPETGMIITEKLFNCRSIPTNDKKIIETFPAYIRAINNSVLQVGFDKENNLKVFDYGLTHNKDEVMTNELFEEIKIYGIPFGWDN